MVSNIFVGFGGTMYTLWEISTSIDYGYDNRPYQKIAYRYIQNLSKNFESAMIKAKEMFPNEDVKFDDSLKGQSSFERVEELFCDLTRSNVRLTTYDDEPIHTCNNIDVLMQLANRYDNTHAINRLVSLGYVYHDGRVDTKENVEKYEKYNSIYNKVNQGEEFIGKLTFSYEYSNQCVFVDGQYNINLNEYRNSEEFITKGMELMNQYGSVDLKMKLIIENNQFIDIQVLELVENKALDMFLNETECVVKNVYRNETIVEVDGVEYSLPMQNKEGYYNGFTFFQPQIKGVGKRVKGKKVTMKCNKNDRGIFELLTIKVVKNETQEA